jgi:AraC-like DNA-binding protein
MHREVPMTRTVPLEWVRATMALAERRGWDVDALLDEAGIPPMLLSEQRSRITTGQVTQLVQALWRVSDDELFGLGPQPVPRGTFRLVCYGLINAPDMRTAVDRFQAFARALPGTPPITISAGPEVTSIALDTGALHDPDHLMADALLAIVHRFVGWAIGRRLPLRLVEFPYPEPNDLYEYDLLFGAPLRFGADVASLQFASEILTAPIMRDEDDLAAYLKNAPADLLERRDYSSSLPDRVRRILEQGLKGAWPSGEDIAARLAMSPQTMRRKLGEHHTSMREIKEEILRDTAIASLARGEESVETLSERLGFSERSAFTRAFRRWTGSTPGVYRRSVEPVE